MTTNFDQIINRRDTGSSKWQQYGDDVLPLWVADMDFVSPEPVLRALHQRIDHGVFGYGCDPVELTAVVRERMARRYGWQIDPESVVYLPGLVSGINTVCRATGQPGNRVLVQTPVYPPFLTAPGHHQQELATAPLLLESNGRTIDYQIDFDAFEAAIQSGTSLFILCNPHNPIGRGFTRDELCRMAEICLRHNVTICSDEIHSDLLLNGTRHIPLASLSPEIEQQTITLIAPSKTYNIPGLGCSMAIVPNPKLRAQLICAMDGIVPHVNILGYVAAQAAYTEGDAWLAEMLDYLTANRDFVVNTISEQMPSIRTTVPQATYLAWLDCRESGIPGNPHKFFLEQAKVALNDGRHFGQTGKGFVRLNFGCPRATLEEGLEKMQSALAQL